jgi:Asp-tRNA(Asn)/Glu-tRNA(Gln) amidotransferase C subunit
MASGASGIHVTRETVEKLAREVAGIELSPADVDQLTPQLDRLLGDLAQVPDQDLEHLEPPLIFDAGEP